jgi:hypothetical protein
MNDELIRNWLQLPPGPWPPDHYTLLGLEPGQAEPKRVEQEVHRRLETVRHYQLTHPQPATEAMNCLARAFVCLSDPTARQAYDDARLGRTSAPTVEEPEAPVTLAAPPERRRETAAARATARTQVDVPAPPPRPAGPAPSVVSQLSLPELPLLPSEPAVPPPAPAPAPPPDPAAEAARSSRARRGLGTRRALARRLVRTRHLARAWEEAGKYLAYPKRRVSRPAEIAELEQLLAGVRDRMRRFPPLLGEAGQPGYLIAALTRQPALASTFQALLVSQRESLARDWWSGRTALAEHREFLRAELRSLRKKSRAHRWWRALRTFVTDQPGRLLLLLALVALNLALWRTLFHTDEATPTPPPSPPPTSAPEER